MASSKPKVCPNTHENKLPFFCTLSLLIAFLSILLTIMPELTLRAAC